MSLRQQTGPTVSGPVLPSRSRIMAFCSVIAGSCGLLAAVPTLPAVQACLLLVLFVCGAGSATSCWVPLPAGALIASVIGLSLATAVGVTTFMVRWTAWHPVPACLILSTMVTGSGLARLWTLKDDTGGTLTLRSDRPLAGARRALVLLIAAVGIWLTALPMLARDVGGEYGLLGTPGGALLVLAAAIAVASMVAALAARRTVVAVLPALATIVITRVTATLITDVPPYTWTYKHIGVVDYLMANHALAPYETDIYQRWPGFFTAMAWFSSVSGVDPVGVAHWFPPVADLLIAVVVGALALTVTRSPHAALIAAVMVQLLNWIAQDYYSPQAMAIVMAFALFSLLFCSRRHVMAGYLSVPIFTAIVWTHQLTPVWVCMVIVALAILRRVRPWWTPVVFILIWVAFVVPRLDSLKRYGLFSFDPVANVAGPTQSERPKSDGYLFTVVVDRGLAVTFWACAAVCVVILWRRKARPLTAAVLAFSPMLLLLSQGYGGEATMRVFLYSLAGCTLLIAPFLARAITAAAPECASVRRVAACALLVCFGAAGMQGFYSNWSFSTVTRTQLAQSRWLLAENRHHPALAVWAPQAGWPERPTGDYVKFALADPLYDTPLDQLRTSILAEVPGPKEMDELEEPARATGYPLYVVLPRQLYQYDTWLGLFKPGVLDGLKKQLATRPGWSVVINDADTLAYRYSQS